MGAIPRSRAPRGPARRPGATRAALGRFLGELAGGLAAVTPTIPRPPAWPTQPAAASFPAPFSSAPPPGPAVGFSASPADAAGPPTPTIADGSADLSPTRRVVLVQLAPAALIVPAAARARVMIENRGPATVWLGTQAVTLDQGQGLGPGDSIELATVAAVWGVCSYGGAAVLVTEES